MLNGIPNHFEPTNTSSLSATVFDVRRDPSPDSARPGIVLAKVSLDDPKNHPLAAQFGVQGFPTIRIFKRMYDSPAGLGTVENFDTQPRTYDAVVAHMRALGLPPQRIDTAEQLADLRARAVRYTGTEVSGDLSGDLVSGDLVFRLNLYFDQIYNFDGVNNLLHF